MVVIAVIAGIEIVIEIEIVIVIAIVTVTVIAKIVIIIVIIDKLGLREPGITESDVLGTSLWTWELHPLKLQIETK